MSLLLGWGITVGGAVGQGLSMSYIHTWVRCVVVMGTRAVVEAYSRMLLRALEQYHRAVKGGE